MEVEKIELLCRACVQVLANSEDPIDSGKHDIFLTVDLAKKFTLCTSLNVEPLDGFPKYLCSPCWRKLNEFYEFQIMCVQSVHRFLELLERREMLELKAQPKVEIIVEEPFILLPERQVGEENQKVKVKMLDDFDTKKCTKRSMTLKRSRSDVKEKQPAELVEGLSNVFGDRTTFSEDSEEEAKESGKEFTSAKQRKKRSRAKCKDVISSGRSRRKSPAQDTKSSSTVYQCNVCSTRFFVEHRLIAHKREHDGLVPYPCPREGCDKSFKRWNRLSHHLQQHEGTNRLFKCEEDGCSKEYRNKETLAMHLRKFHKRGPELKSHICEICGKVFKSSAILNDHRYTHKDKSELPFACDQPGCARRFTKNDKLKVHKMRHAGIKNFECPYCGMRKTTGNELKTHINYHTRERTWPCRFCTQIFNNAGNLKRHVRTVHECAKDYACSYCERTFAKPDTRKYHEMTHTGEKPNECQECGKRFTQPIALRTHQKIHQRQAASTTTLAATKLSGI